MELNITRYFEENDPYYMSGSIANLGSNVGRITWENSCNASDGALLTTEEMRQNARDWFGDAGAWDEEEINTWSNTELEALILQFAAGDINEMIYAYESDYDDDDDLSLIEIIAAINADSDYDNLTGRIYTSVTELYIHVGT